MKIPIILAVAVGGAAIWALVSFQPNPASTSTAPSAEPPDPHAGMDMNQDQGSSEYPVVTGEVLEVLNVPKYTYLRIGNKDSKGTWVAVPTAEVAVGDEVSVQPNTKMTNFQSSTLKRAFTTIYFGTLSAGGNGAPAAGHDGDNPHARTAQQATDVGQVEKAEGGYRISEIYAKKSELSGKKVRVRGVVVKSVNNVMDKNFVHLQDGSGSAESKDHDLTITAATPAEVGKTVLIEGTLATDKDIGAGYKYSVLIEDAQYIK